MKTQGIYGDNEKTEKKPDNEKREKDPIHIKKSHRGLFTKEAAEHGMSVQQFASRVKANPHLYGKAVTKRAVFASNASKWNH